jgi:ketosteroid isomerase-like protein
MLSMRNSDVIRELTRRWNSGDLDGALELYTEDAELHTGPHWPEQTVYRGRDAIHESSQEWASLWDRIEIVIEEVEEHGDRVLATGAWVMRGAASGVDGRMPSFIVCTLRGGKIAVFEWFADRDSAVAAARGAQPPQDR